MGFVHNVGMFLLGLRDSLSLGWINKLIFCTDPVKHQTHIASLALRKSLLMALIRIVLTLFIIPYLFAILGIHSVAFLLRWFFLLLGYGYIFFYNEDIMDATRKIISFRKKQMKQSHFELNKLQKIDTSFYLSGAIKGFIFLVLYYVPIVGINVILGKVIPQLGIFTAIVADAFFNGVFVFLTAWPYDNYNAAFLEQQKYYMLGHGMFVSVVCNYCLNEFLFNSLAVGIIITLWMLINSIVFGPAVKQNGEEFQSFGEVLKVLSSSDARSKMRNSYNIHRQKIKKDKVYSQAIVKQVFFVKPALILTQKVNGLIGKYIFNQ